MKKFRIRFFGGGVLGECEMPFNHEPTVDEVEEMVAMYLEQGLLKLHFDSNSSIPSVSKLFFSCRKPLMGVFCINAL